MFLFFFNLFIFSFIHYIVQPQKQEPSPSSPRPTSSQTPRNNKRIRLSSSTGGQHDLTLPLNVTYSQLQEAIEKELGVPPKEQKIRFGFPPRVLHPPEAGKEEEPIPVQHGERVMVEVLPPPEPQPKEDWDVPEENKMDVAGAVGGEGKVGDGGAAKDTKTEASPMDGKIFHHHHHCHQHHFPYFAKGEISPTSFPKRLIICGEKKLI